jgi:ribonuclease HII
MLQESYEEGLASSEIGLDEAGRGCLMGPVCIGAVILGPSKDRPEPPFPIRDSKKMSAKKRGALRTYIQTYALSYSVKFVWESEIDTLNILKATMVGMHRCLDEIFETYMGPLSRLLVDGNTFPIYTRKDTCEPIPHECIKGGDDLYQSIACASILAKEHRDEYIQKLVTNNPVLEDYAIHKNNGYGTKAHMEALHQKGVTEWHRKSFEPCKTILN